MRFDIITIFPTIFKSYFSQTILKRAQKQGLIKIKVYDLRKFARKSDPHKSVDDRPYGGGPGMILKIEPIYLALRTIKLKAQSSKRKAKERIIMLTPAGKRFTQRDAERLAKYDRLILLCGRYEGFDARVDKLVDEKISIGDYVLAGGELPAMVIVEAVARHISGVVGHPEALKEETFARGFNYVEYPQYTRPEIFYPTHPFYPFAKREKERGWRVPKVLLSGNHADIKKWREKRMGKR